MKTKNNKNSGNVSLSTFNLGHCRKVSLVIRRRHSQQIFSFRSHVMMHNSRTLTQSPFDGKCECSRGGDIRLTFGSGLSVTTHSTLLKMASPIFDSMLTNRAEMKTVAMENTSHKTWVQILNYLHPAGSFSFSGFDPLQHMNNLVSCLPIKQPLEPACNVDRVLGTGKKVRAEIVYCLFGRNDLVESSGRDVQRHSLPSYESVLRCPKHRRATYSSIQHCPSV